MPIFLFRFGYETPAQHRNNKARGWDDEDSQAVFIEASGSDAALEWGREIAEQYVRKLWSIDGDSGPGWKESEFAHWIETDEGEIARANEHGVPRVGTGEHPTFR